MNMLFKRLFLYLIAPMLGNVMPIYTKATVVSNVKKIDCNQQPTILKTPLNKKSKSILKSPRKKNCFVRDQMGQLWRSTTQLGLSLGLIFGLHHLMHKPFELSTLISPMVGNLLTPPIKDIGTSCAILFFPILSKPKLNEAIGLRKQYEAKKYIFSPSLQSFIEKILSDHIWSIQRFDYYDHKRVEVIKELLKFPVGAKQVIPDTGAIRTFIGNYPEEVRLAIGEFVAMIVEDAKSNQLTKKSTPIMLVGPPGTGKTYLAKQLAALLELPLQSIDIANYKNIYGSPYYASSPEKGVIAEALIGSPNQDTNWSNKILVLDEIDKALAIDKNGSFLSKNGPEVYSFLHTLLEAQETALPLSRYNNACPDISQMKIILIANKTFTETLTADRAAALESRVKTIRFDQGFTPDKKKTIATDYINYLLTKKGIDRSLLNHNVIEAIIAEDVRLDLKGVRVLLSVIERYIDKLKYQKLIHKIAGSPASDFDIKQAYKYYEPKEDPVVNSN